MTLRKLKKQTFNALELVLITTVSTLDRSNIAILRPVNLNQTLMILKRKKKGLCGQELGMVLEYSCSAKMSKALHANTRENGKKMKGQETVIKCTRMEVSIKVTSRRVC